MWQMYLAVMAVGAIGCASRMWLSSSVDEKYGPAFPFGTLAVNIIGCFLIGIFNAMTRPDGGFPVSPVVRQAVMVGFLGGFTTFSSFSLQTLALIGDGEWGYAMLNILVSVVLCMAAVWAGQTLAFLLTRG